MVPNLSRVDVIVSPETLTFVGPELLVTLGPHMYVVLPTSIPFSLRDATSCGLKFPSTESNVVSQQQES